MTISGALTLPLCLILLPAFIPACSRSCPEKGIGERGRLSKKTGKKPAAVPRAPSCDNSPKCRTEGLCASRGSRCVAALDKDCARSTACKKERRCAAAGGRCVVPTNVECKTSRGCKEEGLCFSLKGKCIPLVSSHCQKSEKCKKEGFCLLHDRRCVKP